MRNDYEVKFGTFRGARHLDIANFRDFPQALKRLAPELKSQPIVTFCTGGIRCEKAAPLMTRQGFREVYQLDGGILRYFEEGDARHFDGECFVFDERVALTAELQPGATRQCSLCFGPIRSERRGAGALDEVCPCCRSNSKPSRSADTRTG